MRTGRPPPQRASRDVRAEAREHADRAEGTDHRRGRLHRKHRGVRAAGRGHHPGRPRRSLQGPGRVRRGPGVLPGGHRGRRAGRPDLRGAPRHRRDAALRRPDRRPGVGRAAAVLLPGERRQDRRAAGVAPAQRLHPGGLQQFRLHLPAHPDRPGRRELPGRRQQPVRAHQADDGAGAPGLDRGRRRRRDAGRRAALLQPDRRGPAAADRSPGPRAEPRARQADRGARQRHPVHHHGCRLGHPGRLGDPGLHPRPGRRGRPCRRAGPVRRGGAARRRGALPGRQHRYR